MNGFIFHAFFFAFKVNPLHADPHEADVTNINALKYMYLQ